MKGLSSLNHRLDRVEASVPPIHNHIVPCLVPPPDMHLFTEQEQHALHELEQHVIPIIPTGPGSVIERLGGPYQALLAICAPVGWSFREMGIYEQAKQELCFDDWWFLGRWWSLYKNLIISSVPQGRRDRERRYVLCKLEDIIEQFLQIDIEPHRARIEKAPYPFSMQSYENHLQSILHHIEDQEPFEHRNLHSIELWLDFIKGYPIVY